MNSASEEPNAGEVTADVEHHAEQLKAEAPTDTEGLTYLMDTVSSLGCGTIVIIDDNVPDIELLRVELKGLTSAPKALDNQISERGGWPEGGEERWDVVRSIVDGLPFYARRQATTELYAEVSNGIVDWESEFTEPLVALRAAPASLMILSVSPRDWVRHGPVHAAGADQPVNEPRDFPVVGTPIFLFDYDLSNVPGRRPDQGYELARTYMQRAESHSAYCGVISQKFSSVPFADRLRAGMKAGERDRLVLLSRGDMQNYATVADLLKKVYRAHSAVLLRDVATKALNEAHEKASEELSKLEVAPLLHVVVDRSYVEGISEFDTIKRLLMLKLGSALDHHEVDQTLQPLMAKMRAMRLSKQPVPEAVVELEHEERYANIVRVNRQHLPIELGDVFQIVSTEGGKKRKFVLVTQSCDLMVRYTGGRQVTHGVLLRVSDDKPMPSNFGFPLPYAKSKVGGTRAALYVRFRPPLYVPLVVLDLCVFSESGRAQCSTTSTPPDSVPASMVALHEKVMQHVGAIVNTGIAAHGAVAGDGHTDAPLGRPLVVPLGAVDQIAGKVTGDNVQYEVERVMRLSPNIANELLAEYSRFAGRAAAEMGMAEPV